MLGDPDGIWKIRGKYGEIGAYAPASSFFVKALSQFTDKGITINDHDAHNITIKSDYIAFYFALFLNLWIFTSIASIAKSCIFFGAELLKLNER